MRAPILELDVAAIEHRGDYQLMRVLSSAMFITHGWAKMFGERAQPFLGGRDFFGIDIGVNTLWIAGVIELYGGILLVLGLFMRYAALLAAAVLEIEAREGDAFNDALRAIRSRGTGLWLAIGGGGRLFGSDFGFRYKARVSI